MVIVLLLGGRFYRWCWNPEMKIIAAICIGLAIGASARTSSVQQRGSLVTTLANDIPLEFVRITPGEFLMGCSAGDTLCTDDEKPAHRVRITRGFEMGKYEVTSAQWQAVTVKPPVVLQRGDGDDHAYGFANWSMAREFVDGLNARRDGYTYRLPTEAEREYAARAGATGPYAGRSPDALGWFGQNVVGRPEQVGKKLPTHGGFTTCTETHGSGSRTGMTRSITPAAPPRSSIIGNCPDMIVSFLYK
jgi:formylglycine-generating enzyme required for sulfatase activity